MLKIEEAIGDGLGWAALALSKEVSEGGAALGSLKSQREGPWETDSGGLLPAIPLVESPMGAPRISYKKYVPERRTQEHSKEGAPTGYILKLKCMGAHHSMVIKIQLQSWMAWV